VGQGSQAVLHADTRDEAEKENEHGGNIQDVPHDACDEGNDEPFLGWMEKCGQGPQIGIDATPNDFDYDAGIWRAEWISDVAPFRRRRLLGGP
jgi:hypothetical protein